jgi:hypothetical protein
MNIKTILIGNLKKFNLYSKLLNSHIAMLTNEINLITIMIFIKSTIFKKLTIKPNKLSMKKISIITKQSMRTIN